MKSYHLRRRLAYTPHETVMEGISNKIENSGRCKGYRSILKRSINDQKLKVHRDTVLPLMRQIDPDGIKLRKAHRKKRRKYRVKGPNYVWRVDGYDKRKPLGFCIHGAIDSYSRRILWLEVAQSNNYPAVIAMFYLEALKELKVVPQILRCVVKELIRNVGVEAKKRKVKKTLKVGIADLMQEQPERDSHSII